MQSHQQHWFKYYRGSFAIYLTCVWCNALMSTSIVATLLLVGTVAVIRAKFSTQPWTPAPARTHARLGWRNERNGKYKEEENRNLKAWLSIGKNFLLPCALHIQLVQSLRRFNLRLNSCPLEKKLNIVARTESRRDTDSSTVKDTAFVICRTVFITHTAPVWWDNIKATGAVAWFGKNHWEREK